jgi:leucyl-tRNA synthetase
MKILNALDRLAGVSSSEAKEGLSILLRMLSPITPHVCHHLWRELGFGEDILTASWPEPDTAALVTEEIEMVVQVNGKLRGRVVVPVGASEEEATRAALADANVARFIGDKPIQKKIVVPGKLVNIVVA